jgi:hypothetical protein
MAAIGIRATVSHGDAITAMQMTDASLAEVNNTSSDAARSQNPKAAQLGQDAALHSGPQPSIEQASKKQKRSNK